MNETSCYKINGRIFFKHKDVELACGKDDYL